MRGSGEEVGFLWPYPILQPLLCPPCRKSSSKGVLIKLNRCFFGTAWRLLLIKDSEWVKARRIIIFLSMVGSNPNTPHIQNICVILVATTSQASIPMPYAVAAIMLIFRDSQRVNKAFNSS